MSQIKLFPAIEDVFENPTYLHKITFFPLLTVDLNSIEKGNGKVHFISVHGNGDPEVKIPIADIGYNFIKFETNGDKYSFSGDLSQMPGIEKTVEWHKEAEGIYKEHLKNYMEPQHKYEKEHFDKEFIAKQFSFLSKQIELLDTPSSPLYDYLFDSIETGNVLDEGILSELSSDHMTGKDNTIFSKNLYIKKILNYWVTRDKYMETGKFIQGGAYIEGYSNQEREIYEALGGNFSDEYVLEYLEPVLNKLKISYDSLDFVGMVTGYDYLASGEDRILLFVNKKKEEAFQYFCWS